MKTITLIPLLMLVVACGGRVYPQPEQKLAEPKAAEKEAVEEQPIEQGEIAENPTEVGVTEPLFAHFRWGKESIQRLVLNEPSDRVYSVNAPVTLPVSPPNELELSLDLPPFSRPAKHLMSEILAGTGEGDADENSFFEIKVTPTVVGYNNQEQSSRVGLKLSGIRNLLPDGNSQRVFLKLTFSVADDGTHFATVFFSLATPPSGISFNTLKPNEYQKGGEKWDESWATLKSPALQLSLYRIVEAKNLTDEQISATFPSLVAGQLIERQERHVVKNIGSPPCPNGDCSFLYRDNNNWDCRHELNCSPSNDVTQKNQVLAQNFYILPLEENLEKKWPAYLAANSSRMTIEGQSRRFLGVYIKGSALDPVRVGWSYDSKDPVYYPTQCRARCDYYDQVKVVKRPAGIGPDGERRYASGIDTGNPFVQKNWYQKFFLSKGCYEQVDLFNPDGTKKPIKKWKPRKDCLQTSATCKLALFHYKGIKAESINHFHFEKSLKFPEVNPADALNACYKKEVDYMRGAQPFDGVAFYPACPDRFKVGGDYEAGNGWKVSCQARRFQPGTYVYPRSFEIEGGAATAQVRFAHSHSSDDPESRMLPFLYSQKTE